MVGDLRRYAAANGRLRALHGLLLGPAGLEVLYGYPNADAMGVALQRTCYGGDVRGRIAVVARSLAQYLHGACRDFICHYVRRHEVDGIKLAIRVVAAGRPTELAAALLVDLGPLATVDVRGLLKARDIDDLVARLAGSSYHPVLLATSERLEKGDPFALESALEIDFYERLWAFTCALKTAQAKRVRSLLRLLYDILNLQWIAHYRDGLQLSPEEILNYTLRDGEWTNLERRRRLVQRREEWLSSLSATPFEGFALSAERDGVDAALPQLWRLLGKAARRALYGYPFHAAAPFAFLIAQELEVRDIEVLLAMKRLGWPPAQALSNLVTRSE